MSGALYVVQVVLWVDSTEAHGWTDEHDLPVEKGTRCVTTIREC